MTVKLRTVIYQNRAEIENVPIYACKACKRTIVFPPIKDDLTKFIGTLGNVEEKEQYRFDELNEIAHLMCQMADKERWHDSVERIVEERVNELLDLLLLAKSVGDAAWIDEVRQRLSQITNHALSVVGDMA